MKAIIYYFNEEGKEVGFEVLSTLPDEKDKAIEKARDTLRARSKAPNVAPVRHGLLEFRDFESSRTLITSMTQGNVGNEDGSLN